MSERLQVLAFIGVLTMIGMAAVERPYYTNDVSPFTLARMK